MIVCWGHSRRNDPPKEWSKAHALGVRGKYCRVPVGLLAGEHCQYGAVPPIPCSFVICLRMQV